MISENENTFKLIDLVTVLQEKYWENYKSIDEKRKKSFRFLYISILILALFSFQENNELVVFSYAVPFNFYLICAPLFIAFASLTYYYLCARTLDTFVNFIKLFKMKYDSDLETISLKDSDLIASLIQRDFSESLNIFLYPREFGPHWRYTRKGKAAYYLFSYKCFNLFILLTNLLPAITYLYFSFMLCLYSFEYNFKMYLIVIVLCLIILCSSAIIFEYFWHSTRKNIKYFRGLFWGKSKIDNRQ